ncbi:MAG: hypothetical protein LBS56_10125 [Propionibacteriaceae bacterium]|jgi:hypothetical protein|nr:hypothetical protein [Propionibacteriaceae bacterium]
MAILELWHIGVPVTELRPGMTYADGMKLWLNNPDETDHKFEYLRFEAGGPFPEEMHVTPHVAYKVTEIEKHIAEADRVVWGPAGGVGPDDKMAFVMKDGILIEYYQFG